jgi:hypothetical protein
MPAIPQRELLLVIADLERGIGWYAEELKRRNSYIADVERSHAELHIRYFDTCQDVIAVQARCDELSAENIRLQFDLYNLHQTDGDSS